LTSFLRPDRSSGKKDAGCCQTNDERLVAFPHQMYTVAFDNCFKKIKDEMMMKSDANKLVDRWDKL